MVISSLLQKGKIIRYIRWDGMKYGTVVDAVTFKKKNYYMLDNGDYVVETPLGFIRTSNTTELLKAFDDKKES